MSQIRGVVVGHGDLARALVDALQRIAGGDQQLVAVSNTDCDRGQLEERIVSAIGDGPAVVFIDMPTGSCMFAAMRNLDSRPDVRLVTGVNLAMLLEFAFSADGALDQVVERVRDAGTRAIEVR